MCHERTNIADTDGDDDLKAEEAGYDFRGMRI